MKVSITGWNGFLANKLRERRDIEWVQYPEEADYVFLLGSPTFTSSSLTQENAQAMHQYVKETMEIVDKTTVPIFFASTTGVSDIELDHEGTTAYNLSKLFLENYIINHCEEYTICRIGTIITRDVKDFRIMKNDRVQKRIMNGNYEGVPGVDEYLDVNTFVEVTIDAMQNFETQILEYPLEVIGTQQLAKIWLNS